ncbi:hypothetical protein BC628DRAFT_957561 [Trametes gibbosa]|nr:hypothetical protein BC628DRAFT_957561 [Trametes gibbosa]
MIRRPHARAAVVCARECTAHVSSPSLSHALYPIHPYSFILVQPMSCITVVIPHLPSPAPFPIATSTARWTFYRTISGSASTILSLLAPPFHPLCRPRASHNLVILLTSTFAIFITFAWFSLELLTSYLHVGTIEFIHFDSAAWIVIRIFSCTHTRGIVRFY